MDFGDQLAPLPAQRFENKQNEQTIIRVNEHE